MRHPFFTRSRPLVFAHRGGAALAPENTIAAFDRGLSFGADGLELDVRLAGDGQVVVHHDRTLDRTTTLSGPLTNMTADELSAAGVPTLAEVLARYRETRLIIELKENNVELADAVIELVESAGAEARVCLGSFATRVMRAVRERNQSIATSAAREEVRWALYRSWCRVPPRTPVYAGYQIPEHAGATRVVSARFIEHAHRAGLGVQVWTVNDVQTASRLIAWGVDALITDRPDLMVPLVARCGD